MFQNVLPCLFATLLARIDAPDHVQVALTFIVLTAALWVILSKRYPPKAEHWAYGIVGMVLGFWLRG